MKTEILSFVNSNGKRIAGKAYIPDEGVGPFVTVILSHGFGGNYRPFEGHGENYARNGIACILFDFCGGGMESLSDGAMTDMTVLTEVDDLKCVISEVQKLPYVDTENIILHGESQGGMVSAYVASEIPEQIKSLILWYPAFVIPDDSKKRYEKGENICFGTPLSPRYNIDSKDIDIFKLAAGYNGPVLIIHGDRDGIVPIEYSVKMEKAYQNAKLYQLAGADHGFAGDDNIFAIDTSIGFVKSQL